jgi:hypothetical protein
MNLEIGVDSADFRRVMMEIDFPDESTWYNEKAQRW